MKLRINDKYEISTYEYGYMMRKHVGSQWKVEGYYNTLQHAVNSVFEKSILTETNDFMVDFRNITTLHEGKESLIAKIESIRDEILEGLSWNVK